MATRANPQSDGQSGGHSTAVRAAAAAAATGAVAYGIRRLRSNHESDEPVDEAEEDGDGEDDEGRGTVSAKREELTQALSSKISDAKKAASKLKPSPSGRRTTLESAWEAASAHLVPVARDAAASLGATVAKKAPDVVSDELVPGFIEGFEKEAG